MDLHLRRKEVARASTHVTSIAKSLFQSIIYFALIFDAIMRLKPAVMKPKYYRRGTVYILQLEKGLTGAKV